MRRVFVGIGGLICFFMLLSLQVNPLLILLLIGIVTIGILG